MCDCMSVCKERVSVYNFSYRCLFAVLLAFDITSLRNYEVRVTQTNFSDLTRIDRQGMLDAFAHRHNAVAVLNTRTIDAVKTMVIDRERRSEELLDRKFTHTLDRVIHLVSFKSMCMATPARHVGMWLNENCSNMLKSEKSPIKENCKFSWGIYYKWDTIAKNLDAAKIDPRGLTLRKLYNAKKENLYERSTSRNGSGSSAQDAGSSCCFRRAKIAANF